MRKPFVWSLAAVLAAAFAAAAPASAALVEPVEVPGNPTCADRGYGANAFPLPDGPPVSGRAYGDGTGRTVTFTHDGTVITGWSANFTVDAVVVKGGSAANVYTYPGGALADGGLQPPDNASGGPAELSHVEVCWRTRLQVEKTAVPAHTRTTSWTLDKTVDVPAWNLFRGDSATSFYAIDVGRSVTDARTVSGVITVTNPDEVGVTLNSVTDTIPSLEMEVPVTCPTVPSFPFELDGGATLTCTYGPVTLPDGATRTNVASADAAVEEGPGPDGQGTAVIDFTDVVPTQVGPAFVRVEDSAGPTFFFEAPGRQVYSRTFQCDRDAGVFTNTATMFDGGEGGAVIATDAADVAVTCNALDVSKTAVTTMDRSFTWAITNTPAPAQVADVAEGATTPVTYAVTATPTATDGNFAVSGTVTVRNPAEAPPVLLVSLTDAISGIASPVPLDCGETTFPTLLEPGRSVQCTYATPLPDGAARVNTATAVIENRIIPEPELVDFATTSFTATAPVTFTAASVRGLVDENAAVTDSAQGALGTATAGGVVAPTTFTFTRALGPVACGSVAVVPSTASFVTNDRAATASAPASVSLSGVACAALPPEALQAGAAPGALRVTKTGPAAATAGQLVTYRITVRNTGRSAASGVVVRDVLPSGYALARRAGGATLSRGVVTWRVGRLSAGASRTVTATFRIDRSVSGRRCNTATASASGIRTVRDTACTRIAAIAGATEPAVTG